MARTGRPKTYADSDVVKLSAPEVPKRLNANSDRRAVINTIIEAGGRMTLKEIDESFGFDIRATVLAMVRAGWLEIAE